jgi:hypothetical protein
LDGKEASKKNSFVSGEGAGRAVGVLKDPTLTHAHHLRLHSNRKNPGALNRRLRRTRMPLLVSRWRLLKDADLIQEKLLLAVDANPSVEAPPQFLYSKFAQGVF